MSLKNFSTTPANNQSGSVPEFCPEGWALSSINAWGASLMADVRSLAAADTIASATTTDLGTKDSTFLTVSGVTTITGLGTVSAGIYKFIIFSGALTLTHNGTSLILPGAANITTVAGDTALFLSLGSGNWKCMFYQTVDGDLTAIAALTTTAFGRGMLEYADAATAFAALKQAASETATGVVEFATTAEAAAGTDTARAVTPAGMTAAIAVHAIGEGQTWQDLTASRALSINYTNSTGRSISLAIYVSHTNTAASGLTIDGVVVSKIFNNVIGGVFYGTHSVIVPPGDVYSLAGGTVIQWNELR